MYHKSLFPPLPKVPPQNIHNILLNRPEQADWPDYTLHIDALTGVTRSFPMSSLGGLGIRLGNGELVGVLSENSMDYVALLHSLLVTTVPFVMFSAYSTPFELQHTIKLAAPTRLFVSPILLPLALTSGLPDDRIYILEGHVPGRVSYGELVERARKNGLPRLPVQPAQNDTLAYLVFSSGTSGLPKAVMISHGNLIESISQLTVFSQESLKVQGSPVWNGLGGINVNFLVLPIHHTYGLHIAIFRSFMSQATVLLLSKWDAEKYFDSIPKYRVTSMYLGPIPCPPNRSSSQVPTVDFSTIQTINCGAAYLPVSLADKLLIRLPGVERMSGGYGMSECTLTASMRPVPGMLGGRIKHVPGSVGVLLPGVEARIVREDGELAALNEPGELHIRTGCVALGYWNNQKATDETFKDGWLRTGDRMRIDADGAVYFEDRAKDTLKISGMQVSPMEIEDTLLMQPDNLIIDVTVAGVSGGRTSDERLPRAWVVLSPAGEALNATEVVARLEAWVRETLSRYKWLRGGIAVVNQIPKSPTGKVLRRVLVDEYETNSESRKRSAKL
ncbi:acetyl-CoA synthetase-like protein [Chiua virens]|nr:acetyl-CoA synthetase-like protein [Chiua virens]